MSQKTKHFYEFGRYQVDIVNRLLLRGDEIVSLPPKSFDLLLALVEVSGQVLSKDELMQRVWRHSFVEEANLSHHVFTLRKALGEDKNGAKYIETIPRRGYRFVAEVTEIDDAQPDVMVVERTRSHIVIDEEGESRTGDKAIAVEQAEAGKTLIRNGLAERPFRRKTSFLIVVTLIALLGLSLAGYFLVKSRPTQEATGEQVKSIAVLPFKPLTADTRNESLELGMADTLINKLSGIKHLVVRPVSAIRNYTGLEQDSLTAGRELGVDYVVEGNLQMVGDKTRATVRLLSVKDGKAIWTDKCDQSCNNIFELQDAVAQQIAIQLALQLSGDERTQLAKHYTENTEAYQLFLKGRYFWNKFTEDGLQKSLGFYQQAIDKDPNYALAYTGMANAYSVLGVNGPLSPKDAFPKQKQAVEKALELDDNLAQAHQSLGGFKLFYEWEWSGAEREFKRAMELDPSYTHSHELYGYLLRIMGRFDEALVEIRKAQELDPVSLLISGDSGETLRLARRYDQAIEEYNKTLAMDPNFADARFGLGIAYAQNGMPEKAVAEINKAIMLSGNSTHVIAALGRAHALSGKRAEAQKVIAELLEIARQRYVSPLDIAIIYATLGDSDKAFSWLEKAYEEHACWLIELGIEPCWDKLHSDPRFTQLLGRVGLPQAAARRTS